MSIGSYMSVTGDVDVLANLHDAGLISETQRLEALHIVGDLAVEMPDADWLDVAGTYRLFSEDEVESLLDRVRDELITDLESILRSWSDNEQGDSAEAYYEPLGSALERYKREFADDAGAVARLNSAISDVESLKLNSLHWGENEYYEGERPTHGPDIGSNSARVTLAEIQDVTSARRDIFDDVDAE